jgi:pimeloyl-ACP methyl ester carboxylesterase
MSQQIATDNSKTCCVGSPVVAFLARRFLSSDIICVVTYAILLSILPNQKPLTAQAPANQHAIREGSRLNIPLPTLGGQQFWTDHRWSNGIRLQFNSTVNHWRILSRTNVRLAWGTREAMILRYAELTQTNTPLPSPQHYVVLLHGLMRSSDSMEAMEIALTNLNSNQRINEQPEIVPIAFRYASSRDSIAQHSAALCELIENLPQDSQLSFVGHSLGNIVLRHSIGRWQEQGDPKKILTRFHRVVMLGPPNQGSVLAEKLSRLKLFEIVTGSSGVHLGKAWDDLQSQLATPACPFLIVTGDLSDSGIGNPLLRGPSDGIVTREEAMLEGAAAVRSFPQAHTWLMSDPEIIESTLEFLELKP